MGNPYRQQAKLIKALAHPSRLHIVEVLSKGEACVCHLTTILRQRQPNVSQHLMVLREAGLVQDRKDGLMVYYRLSDDRVADLCALSRQILRASGVEVGEQVIPSPPVKGCPCPNCTEAADGD